MLNLKFPYLFYGGDYNPEQWDEIIWDQDIRLMKKAGVNLVSLGIFSWSHLQPNENTFTFKWLDTIMTKLNDAGIFINLATPTAAQPAWLSQKYKEILPVNEYGIRLSYGSRQSYCPNSPVYKEFSSQIVRKLADRYKEHPGLILWHVNNEYACHNSECYCDVCITQFRKWLIKRYHTVDALNLAWGASFWSQKYYKWEEIILPKATTTAKNPGQVLDYKRFMSESHLKNYIMERDIIKKYTPNIPVTTNFLPGFKNLNYFKWAHEIDFISYDSYPDPAPGFKPSDPAMLHDLYRGLKHGKFFFIMEQAPNQVQWRDVNVCKPPGMMRLLSYQAIAHGANAILFFQWRQSRFGAEKFHSAMIPHNGRTDNRISKEVGMLGKELKKLEVLLDTHCISDVAIIFDYENWWSVENHMNPSNRIKYPEQIGYWYEQFYNKNISIDFVPQGMNLSQYKIVLAPLMYMVHPDAEKPILEFVKKGGIFITTFFSGVVDGTDTLFPQGSPGPLQDVLGIEVEEFAVMGRQMKNSIKANNTKIIYDTSLWCDIIKLKTAVSLAQFEEDYFAGAPAVTVNGYGMGKAFYFASLPDYKYTKIFLDGLLKEKNIFPALNCPPGVEVNFRKNNNDIYYFIINHTNSENSIQLSCKFFDLLNGITISGDIKIKAQDVKIFKKL